MIHKKIIKLGVISAMFMGLYATASSVDAVKVDAVKVDAVKVDAVKVDAVKVDAVKFVANELTTDEIAGLKAKFPKLLSQMEVTRSKKYGVVTQFEVEARTPQGPVRFSSFVVDGVDYVFSGNAYDKDANMLSLPMDMQKIKDAVAFKVGNGAKQLYLFTEPECPYCQRMEANLDPEKTKDYTINILPMPLSMHKEAKPMLYWVLSAANEQEKATRLHLVMTGDNTYKSFKANPEDIVKFEELFSKVNKVASEVGASGTPSVFGENMEKINYSILLKK